MAYFNLPYGIRISIDQPIDGDRYLKKGLSERNQIISEGRGHAGLQVFDSSEGKLYILKDPSSGIWNEITDASTFVSNPGITLLDMNSSSGIINLDMSIDRREKITLNGDASFNLVNLSSIYSRTVMIDIKASSSLRTISWDPSLNTNNWANGDILTLIDSSTSSFVVNINTNGSSKSDVLINWIKKGL